MNKNNYTLFLVLVLLGISNVMFSQQTKETATQAVLGENTANNSAGDHWFKYTPSVDGILTISSVGKTTADTYVILYDSNENTLAGNDNTSQSLQSEIKIEVVSGSEYFIKWRNYLTSATYAWDLSIRDIEDGDFCSNALDAIEGNNNIDLSNLFNGSKWLKYTPTIDGFLTLDNTITPNNTWIEIYSDCNNNWIQNFYNKKEYIVVEANKTYYFKCKDYTTSLEFNLSIRPFEDGDFCSSALDAVEGTNNIDLSNGSKWLKYTATMDGFLSLENAITPNKEGDEWIKLYSDCNNTLDYFYNKKEYVTVEANKTYYFKCNANTLSLEFNLSIRPFEDGDFCYNALDAVEGVNNIDLSNGSKWLKYTATMDGFLTLENAITPPNNNIKEANSSAKNNGPGRGAWITLYSDCDRKPIDSFYEKKETITVEANETYYFECESNTPSLEFNLSIRPFEDGDFCSTALDAVEGVNNIDLSNGSKWLKYTTTIDGILSLENAITPSNNDREEANSSAKNNGPDGDAWIYLYSDCDNQIDGFYDKKEYITVEANETYYFKCNANTPSLEFNLLIRPFEDGDFCSTALDAVEGVNNIDLSNGSKWLKYTTTIDGILSLENAITPSNNDREEANSSAKTNRPGGDAWIYLYSDCNNQIDGFYEKKEYVIVAANETYYFKCNANTPSLEFNLSIRAIEDGDMCSSPIIAHDGENTLNRNIDKKYFSYDATSTGLMTIKLQNAIADANFEIYNDCNLNNMKVKSINGEAFIKVSEGEQFIIQWTSGENNNFDKKVSNNTESIKWDISITTSELGDICSEAVEISLGEQISDLSGNGKWYYINSIPEGVLEVKSNTLNKDVRAIVAKYGCSDYKYGYGISNALNPPNSELILSKEIRDTGNNLYIYIDDYNNNSDFSWSVTIRDYIAGENQKTPKEAILGTNTVINNVFEYNFYTYTASTTGELNFSTNKMLEQIFVYISDDEYYDSEGTFYYFSDLEDKLLIDVVEGETYYFALGSDEMYNNFTWELAYTSSLGNNYNTIEKVNIYPIPAIDEINIKIQNTIESIEIYDMIGIKVYSETNVNSKSNKINLNINSGSYIIRISDILGTTYSKTILIK